LNLAGAVALLLWGSYMVRAAVEKAYSAKIGAFIAGAAGSRIKSFLCGLVSALVLQSATATVMLTTSFITSGLLSLGIAIVIIIGADMGSALAVRILFLDLSFVAPLLLMTGLCFHRFARTWRRQQLGRIFIGVGLMLLSIQLIKQVVAPVSTRPVPDEILAILDSAAWLGLILAALLTWLAHSSVAVILVIASMAEVGLLQPPLFISTLLGANIGSGLIALALVNRHHTETYSAVLANFAMRLGLALIMFMLSFLLVRVVDNFGSTGGIQVINLHIAYNLVLALLFIPLNNYVAQFSNWLLNLGSTESLAPDSLSPGSSLDPALVGKPKLALSCAKREAFRLADNTEALFGKALQMFDATDRLIIEQFIERDKEINARNKAIQRYLSETRRYIHSRNGNNSSQEERLDEILRFSTTMENIGDIVSHNLARLAIKRIDRGVVFSSEGQEELNLIHTEVLKLIQLEITNFASDGKVKNKPRNKLVESINQLGQESIFNHRRRLSDRKSSSIGTSSMHQDAVRDMLQVVGYISNMDIS
jgi:phosphate:Na+ symporter